jgi:hypothetical protein
MEYITCHIGGRLGNNMFMIAHAYAKALDNNKRFVVYKDYLTYNSDNYPDNIFRKIDLVKTLDKSQTAYVGYFQSESYFENYSENIKSLFSYPIEFEDRIRKELPFIFEGDTTVINVRRGDYLHSPNYHPTVSIEYIHKALERIPNTRHYLIASDDIPWCKQNIQLPNSTYLEGYKSYEQLWVLSMCKNFVISNSSFSWWAAYLSRHPQKIVIAPETWFGPEYPHGWESMYCKDWIVLPTYFDKGLIKPK